LENAANRQSLRLTRFGDMYVFDQAMRRQSG
jgi:hypothetical protein